MTNGNTPASPQAPTDAPTNFKKVFFFQRTWLVEPRAQLALVFHSTLCMAVGIITPILSQYFGIDPSMLADSGFLAISYYSFVGIVFTGMILLGLFLSNRIVGPVFRLQIHMKKCVEGEQSKPISFRKGDYFEDLAATFNEFASQLPLIKTAKTQGKKSSGDPKE